MIKNQLNLISFRQKIRSFLGGLTIALIFFLGLELLTRLFAVVEHGNRYVFKGIFCDPIHFNLDGEKKSAQCFKESNNFGILKNKLWFFGGSTTDGHNCNTDTSWVDMLKNEYERDGYQIQNFAKGGENSDYTISSLNSALKLKRVDSIFIGVGQNEFMFYGDKRDPNFLEISKRLNIFNQKIGLGFKLNAQIWLMRLNSTFHKYSTFYSLLDKILLKKWVQNKNDFFMTFLSDLERQGEEETKRDVTLFRGGHFGAPIRYFWSQPAQDYAFINLELNLMKVKKLSSQFHFDVHCLVMPHQSNYYNSVTDLDRWYEKSNQKLIKICKDLNFRIINIDQCFASKKIYVN